MVEFKCRDFDRFTHPSFCIAGCYGCGNATIGIDYVYCLKDHICVLELVPVMDDIEPDSIFCEYHRPINKRTYQLCSNCKNNVNDTCKREKKIREIVVRLV